jgi:chromosome partitioning protein
MPGGKVITTISAHVMRVLYHKHIKKMLLIDLDPQFNLTQCLMTRASYDALKKTNKTIFTAMEPPSTVGLFDVAVTSQAPPAPNTLSTRLRRFSDETAFLDLIPGNFDLVKYSLVTDPGKLQAAKQRFLHFVALARKTYDIVVIDCNPSSSFITYVH